MSNKNKYLVCALTLCAIGAASAGLIALTNEITHDIIIENENKMVKKALEEVLPDAEKFSEEKNDFSITPNYLQKYYIAYGNNDEQLGYVYLTSGSNQYGQIKMMVSISNNEIGQISIVSNTQSFASTLEEGYIVPYQNGDISIEDVKCGATFGAKLIKEMAEEARYDYSLKKGDDN